MPKNVVEYVLYFEKTQCLKNDYSLSSSIAIFQVLIDRLLEECRNVRTLVVKSRPSQKIHPDVDKLEEDVRKLRMRWEHTCSQIIERFVFKNRFICLN